MAFRRVIAAVLVGCLVLLGQVHAAGLISTEQVAQAQAQRDANADRALVLETLQRAEVQSQLQTLGVDSQAAADRVAAMSDQEVSQLAGKIENLPAGGVSWLGVLLVVVLALVITDILGYTDIFPFVDAQR
jgi:hypothetical protein